MLRIFVVGLLAWSLILTAVAVVPIITNNRTTYEIPDGETVNISCKVIGDPEPSITWEVDGNNVSKLANPEPFNFIVSENDTLEIRNPRTSKAYGLFNVTCIAENTHGNARKTFRITLFKVPRILTQGKRIEIFEYETTTVNFDCVTTGYPRPEIEWKFGGNVLNATHRSLSGPYVIHVINNENILVQSSYTLLRNGRLKITNPVGKANVPHENFTCVARNIAGQDSRSHELYIGETISHTFKILLREEFTGNEENISKKIRDSLLVVKPYSINITSVNSSLRTVNFEVLWRKEDLMRGREAFKVQEIAVNVEEALKNGGIGLLNLLMNGKPGPPTDLTVIKRKSSEITFSWSHPKHFIVDHYHIQRKDDSELGGRWINAGNIDGGMRIFKLDDLDSDKKYLIRVFGIRENKDGEYSENLVASTKASVPTVVIVVVVLIVFFVLLVLFLGYFYYRQRRQDKPDIDPFYHLPNIYTLDGLTYCPTAGHSDNSNQPKYFSWIEIPRDDLAMGGVLGQGEFGVVVQAIWTDRETKRETPVAIKTIKGNTTETDVKEFFQELELMAGVPKHPNVVHLVGACCLGEPLYIVLEFCEHGKLLDYLRQNRTITSPGSFVTSLSVLSRVKIAYDVSKGMRHLEERKIVHRDLAARNVLLGENKIGKVSDFGLSRDIYETGWYQRKTAGKLPVKWMAIESLQEAVFTTKSDVWSFGVLFWEIESAGMAPYPGIDNWDVLEYLNDGYRLAQQPDTPPEISDIMRACWHPDAETRPSFLELQTKLESFFEEHSDYPPVVMDDSAIVGTEAPYVNYIAELDDD